MPPRLNHNKTRTGCSRCKTRKVKCDELRPRCTACARHNVDCIYAPVLPRGQQQQPLPPHAANSNALVGPQPSLDHLLDPLLELRLMHEWTAFVCTTFSTACEFWKFQAPLLGFEYRYVLDGLLCLAALHASRQEPQYGSATEGHIVPRAAEPNSIEHAFSMDPRPEHPTPSGAFDHSKLTEPTHLDPIPAKAKQHSEMLQMSRVYFERALEGHQRALQAISPKNVEAVYVTSICVAYASLFHLSEVVDDRSSPINTPEQWARLSRGTRVIVHTWHNMHGDAYLRRSGVFAGLPDLSDGATLYAPQNARPFAKLLTHARDYELLPLSDLQVYAQTLSYIGLIYTGIHTNADHPLATCRRINAMWSVLPERFLELLEEGRPRALAMLMCVFGCMKLVEGSVEWFRGIAEVWVPRLYARMPNAWVEVCGWPTRVVQGDVRSAPVETEGDVEEGLGGES